MSSKSTPNRHTAYKKNSQYFDEAFAVRPPYNSARERVLKRDSLILVELKTNAKLPEESFLSDLTTAFAELYQRPFDNILVTVTKCEVLLASNSEPSYLMTVTALRSSQEVAAFKNIRSAKILQAMLEQELKIQPSRGIIKFGTIKEENLATNGKTILDEVDRHEKQQKADEKRNLNLRSRASSHVLSPPKFARRLFQGTSETATEPLHDEARSSAQILEKVLVEGNEMLFNETIKAFAGPKSSTLSGMRDRMRKASVIGFWKRTTKASSDD